MEYSNSNDIVCFPCKSPSKPEFTSYILDEELKQIIYKQIITAQDPRSCFSLSTIKKYDIYHEELEKHFIKNYGKKPTQTDNLAFILLLTYPKENIERFTNFNNLKLAFNNILEESDFESKGYTRYETFGFATCICNEDIMWVHNFRNKYSGISIQIGSVCNKRYGLISPKDPNFKSDCKLMSECKEREKEIKEGKPIGYYEELRKADKEEKLKLKLEKELIKKDKKQMKIDEKQRKIDEKQRKINEKQEEEIMRLEDSYTKRINSISHYKKCVLCKKEGLYSRYCKLIVCYNCVSSSIRIKINLINDEILKKKRQYKTDDCLNCEDKFTYRYKDILKCFCNVCEKKYKKMRCKLCPNDFIDVINSSDVLCNVCDEKSKECLSCKNKFMPIHITCLRCNLCQFRFENKIIVRNCQECDKEMVIKENEKWKNYCGDCFKNNLKIIDCSLCKSQFKRLSTEIWRNKCKDCFIKTKNNYI
jgi:hypothetical protein